MAPYLRFWLSMFFFTHVLAAAVALTGLVWFKIGGARSLPASAPGISATQTPLPAPSKPVSPSPATATPSPASTQPPPGAAPPPSLLDPGKLIIPVAGIQAENLRDTFNEARSEGRTHNAIDIMAERGTSVLAAADGEIIRLYSSDRGGNSIYQWSSDKKFVFYYAHLDRFADGITAGHEVRQGEVIAYVGDTGNAVKGSYHLHFSIWAVTDQKRYWDGVNINPYPILRNSP
jgi:peptidoglycan LD-endopeptidase LytH